MQASINSGNNVNIMTLAYIAKLGFITQKIYPKVTKIDILVLKIYGIVSASSLLYNSLRSV